jgi:serine/threonine protein kinase
LGACAAALFLGVIGIAWQPKALPKTVIRMGAGMFKERIQGTPDYIAPEQVARRPVTVQTDVFNLGATLKFSDITQSQNSSPI